MIGTVVPDVPSYSVDAGFKYRIPERFAGRVELGSRVRIPLGGRRTGGTVIEIHDGEGDGLRDISGVSGSATVLDEHLLSVLEWAASHYVAPLSSTLTRAAPPNVPPGPPPDGRPEPKRAGRLSKPTPSAALDDLIRVVEEAVAGHRIRPQVWLGGRDHHIWIDAVFDVVDRAHRSMIVVVPTAVEVRRLATSLHHLGSKLACVDPDRGDADITEAWRFGRHRGGLLIGTPRIAAWPVDRLAVFAVIEESRRAMKDRQTPTVHVRDIARRRSQRQRLTTIFAGATPSLEVLSWGPGIIKPHARAWPFVEVVDRRQDPPGSGMVAPASVAAARAVGRDGGSVFVFAHRRGYSAAARCVACRTLRRCPSCGSRPDPGVSCQRCGSKLGPCAACHKARFEPLGAGVGRVAEEMARLLGRDMVAQHPDTATVTVGSERDLVDVGRQDLVIAVDLDGLIYGPNYRSAEEALRIGARLASVLRDGTGRRLMAQTSNPDHHVVEALKRGDPLRFADIELPLRESLGYPPAGSLLVIEVRGGDESQLKQIDADLGTLAGGTVHGPARSESGRSQSGPSQSGTRWLVQGPDLAAFRTGLRPLVQRWRDSRMTIRIDADPIDL